MSGGARPLGWTAWAPPTWVPAVADPPDTAPVPAGVVECPGTARLM